VAAGLPVAPHRPGGAFPGRAAEAGDPLGCRVLVARLVRDVMRLCLLLERRYAPYPKWLGTAFARLDSAATIGPLLAAALAALPPIGAIDQFVDSTDVLGFRPTLCRHIGHIFDAVAPVTEGMAARIKRSPDPGQR
jgi:hypothetical protein